LIAPSINQQKSMRGAARFNPVYPFEKKLHLILHLVLLAPLPIVTSSSLGQDDDKELIPIRPERRGPIMENKKSKSTEDVLKVLCDSVKTVLNFATQTTIAYSPMVQKVDKTCLKPDIGCFVLFDGGFSGLVVMNFSKEAAMEIYRNYMISMGMPEAELATLYTSDEVGNTLGELMNQIIGKFQVEVKREFQCSVNQNQPKMIVLNKEIMVLINAPIQNPQYRKVAFETANHRPFYLEICIEKFEFIELYPFEKTQAIDADALIAEVKGQG